MSIITPKMETLAPDTFRFYRHVLEVLRASGTQFLVGGAYALNFYTGITRHTKDLDLFVRAADVDSVLRTLTAEGYRGKMVFSHWLGKAFHGDDFIDVIFSSGNGLCPVDDAWLQHAIEGIVLDAPVLLAPAEEMIWQKAFIMERERFDGADVIHLLRARGQQLDWDRLLHRFGANWRVLLSHLVLFGFVYPDERDLVPRAVLDSLIGRMNNPIATDRPPPACHGTLLSRMQYLPAIEEWGYADPRLQPVGSMTEDEVVRWTDAGR